MRPAKTFQVERVGRFAEQKNLRAGCSASGAEGGEPAQKPSQKLEHMDETAAQAAVSDGQPFVCKGGEALGLVHQ